MGLYRGMGPTLLAVAPFLAFQQSVYDIMKFTALANDVPAGLPLYLGCGATAGAAAQSLVYVSMRVFCACLCICGAPPTPVYYLNNMMHQ